MKKTCLYPLHEKLGAKMAEFGGYLMPIQYSGILKEHQACRERAVLFDTDHMGVFRVTGPHALQNIEMLVSCDVASMATGQCRYGLMCNPAGGVIDDLLVYRLGGSDFMLVVNAGTKEGDLAWIQKHLAADTHIENQGSQTAKIDLQGPESPWLIQRLLMESVSELKFFRFMHNSYRDRHVIVSRTGYTGEIGFEIYITLELAQKFWQDCMELEAIPAGLGARDTLRLEMGMPLYGHELSTRRNAGESGLERVLSSTKEFIGSTVVNDRSLRRSRLVGIEIQGRRAARQGDEILDGAGMPIGTVTSGSFSPSLGFAIALGYVPESLCELGTPLKLKGPRSELDGKVVGLPFYTQATGRGKMHDFLAAKSRG
ncbi:MAG: glycine cleavage system aminomethyltransferase GcvT [Kiritimatiellia bacterium]